MEHRSEENSTLTLELRCIALAVLKNIWIVLALAVSAACLCFVTAKVSYSPSYTSSTTFVISRAGTSSSAYSNLQSAKEMVPTFQSLVNSDLMRKRISADMGLDYLPGSISVSAVPETNLVTISATSSRPDTAFQMLKSLMKVYPQVGEKALGKVILEVFDQPVYPTAPVNPFAGARIMEMAFLIVAVLSAGVMAVYFYLRDTIKTPEQVKDKLDTQLFSTICHERPYRDLHDFFKHKKKSMRMSDPSTSFFYEETIKKISTKLIYKLRTERGQVVLLTSTLPGEGKSTLAMNLAQDMGRRGKKVLLIEGDLQNPGLGRVLRLEEPVPDWSRALSQHQDPADSMVRLDQYSFTALLNSIPMAQAADALALSDLPRRIEAWKGRFDVILVDAPPVRHRSDAEFWARCSDVSLLVVRQDLAEAKYINDSIDMLNNYGSGLLGCLYNDAIREREFSSSGYGYGYGYGSHSGYGGYGSYNRYGSYGKYGKYDHRPDGGRE